jgi:hypothetical protein
MNIRSPQATSPKSIAQDEESLRYNAANSSAGSPISIEASTTWDSKSWWYATRVDELRGRAPTFEVTLPNIFQSIDPNLHNIWWSYQIEGADWFLFDNESYSGNSVTASNNAPFSQNTVYVAHYPIFPVSRMQRRVDEWMADPNTQDLPDGTGGVFDSFPSITDPLNSQTIPQIDARGFIITEGSGNKNAAFLGATVHANEAMATWAFEAAIDYLLGTSAKAQALRQNFEFYVYPTLAASGQWAGYFRSTPHEDPPTQTMNRDWGTADILPYNIHEDSFSNNFSADFLDAVFDFHTQNNNAEHYFFTESNSGVEANYLSDLQGYEPNASITTSTTSTNTRRYLRDNYGKSVCLQLAPETGADRVMGISDWQKWGEDLMKALEDRLQAGAFTYSP